MFEPGDKVSLINDQQRGTLISVNQDGTCAVETGDGFLLTVRMNELVTDRDFLLRKKNKPSPEQEAVSTERPPLELIEASTAAFLLIPEYGKITSGKLSLHFVNHSSSTLLVSLFRAKPPQQQGMAAFISPPDSSQAVFECPRSSTNGLYLDFSVNALVHRNSPSFYTSRLFREMQLPLPGLKENFSKFPSPFSFASSEMLYREQEPSSENFDEALLQLKDNFNAPINKSKSTRSTISAPALTPENMIDLHIEELIDDPARLMPAEILPYQLACLRAALDSGESKSAYNLIVIHGLGTGRLRDMVRKELQERGLKFRDAEYARFGAGATEVLF